MRSIRAVIKKTLVAIINWFKYSGYCPDCGGYLVQDKCDAYTHGPGFYKIYTCTKCGKEWTIGSGI